MIVFKYKKNESGISRPVADIKLKVNNLEVGVAMYIDSGADISMIPRGTGELLGFQKAPGEKIKEMHGIAGGGVPYLEKEVVMIFGKKNLKIKISWALIEEVPPLLGRKDIFSRFRITFDEARDVIEFKEKR